ncbi:glutamyl-tRNA amidotransferase subunit A [Aulographum hederae CBS 113979]|uniref:Glutamyl-tRNA(Gln) amidotransferase subunit A, mitochondrial n=1 Tax=Aulographum hederae CBS 113979 TaxID=1176131 RepID=A0A6G1H2Z9_9PEZI|nr:glutamyl-tRNA amidotransferase subunit A [Aulographum hederae CBS 113979]
MLPDHMSLLRDAQACIAKQASRKNLNAFISLAEKTAVLKAAEDADRGSVQGPLAGRLIGVKDNISTSDLPTTCASGILQKYTSPYDATVISKLRQAGGIVAGKTNLDEFGMGSHSKHSFFGPVVQENGDNTMRSVGGSSGGSAAAVATGQCWAALGTDTGGSVRLPAAYTGIVGFKPSYGLLSRWGVVAYANSLDTVGILSQSSVDSKQIFDVLSGYDPRDPTSLPKSTRARISKFAGKRFQRGPLRIGVPAEYNITTLSPTVHSSWISTLSYLQAQGHTIHHVFLPTTKQALSAYYVLAPAEASSNLAKYDGVRFGTRAEGPDGATSVLFSATRGQGFGDEVKRRILLGAYTLSADAIDNYFIQAQKVRRLVQRDFDKAFRSPNPLHEEEIDSGEATENEGVDVLVCPTAPTLTPTIEDLDAQNPLDAYKNDVFTVPASLAGLPAISIPVTVPEANEKVGIQVIGQFGHDELVLDIGSIIEKQPT